MKDNKLYKVLRIIFLTLAIISIVFTLCKKVGLCASGGSSGSDSNLYLDSYRSIPMGNRLGYASNIDIDDNFRSSLLSTSGLSSNVLCFVYEEQVDSYIDFQLFSLDMTTYGYTNLASYSSCKIVLRFVGDSVGVRYDITNNTFTNIGRIPGSAFDLFVNTIIYENPAYPTSGLEYVITRNKYYFHYPVFFYNSGFQSLVSRSGQNIIFPIYMEAGSGDTDFNDFEYPSYSDLPEVPSSGNTDYNLYQWLNGHNKNEYDYTKSIFDIIKGFFVWFTEPFDSEAASDSLGSIQVISDIRSLNNVIGSSGIFNWSDVTPASRIAFTFDFGGAVLPHHQYEVNFDWYTGTVKTLILSILVTFLVIGLLVTIINNIPSMLHGHSGDSGGGSN